MIDDDDVQSTWQLHEHSLTNTTLENFRRKPIILR